MDVSNASEGDWIVIRSWGLSVRQITKVTPRLFKLGKGSQRYPTQIARSSAMIVCSAADADVAERLRAAIAGIDGEFDRRREAADKDRWERVKAAEVARDAATASLLADWARA